MGSRAEHAGGEAARLTSQDVADRWGVTVGRVQIWVLHGVRINGRVVRLGCVHAGRYLRFSEQHLAAFSADCERAKRGEPFEPPADPDRAAAAKQADAFFARRGKARPARST